MAERRAQNKYYPPDFDPELGTLNQQVRRRSSRHVPIGNDEKRPAGIKVRMEMPFHVWCEGCGGRIAQGTRFNARKQSLIPYLGSIDRVSLEVKCPACKQTILLHTDPHQGDYEVKSGARRETVAEVVDSGKDKMVDNPFFRLEHETRGLQQAKRVAPTLTQLQAQQDAKWRDDFALGHALRRRHRMLRDKEDPEWTLRKRLEQHHVELLPERKEDVQHARSLFKRK